MGSGQVLPRFTRPAPFCVPSRSGQPSRPRLTVILPRDAVAGFVARIIDKRFFSLQRDMARRRQADLMANRRPAELCLVPCYTINRLKLSLSGSRRSPAFSREQDHWLGAFLQLNSVQICVSRLVSGHSALAHVHLHHGASKRARCNVQCCSGAEVPYLQVTA